MSSKIKLSLVAFFLCNNLLISSEIINNSNLTIKMGLAKLIDEQKKQDKRINKLEKMYLKLLERQNKLESAKKTSIQVNASEFIVNAWGLNVRKNPSVKSRIIRGYSIGDTVKAKKYNSNWYQTNDGYFISSKYLQEKSIKTIRVKKNSILRLKPFSDERNIIKRFNKEEKLKAIGFVDGWYVVENGNFIHESYIQ